MEHRWIYPPASLRRAGTTSDSEVITSITSSYRLAFQSQSQSRAGAIADRVIFSALLIQNKKTTRNLDPRIPHPPPPNSTQSPRNIIPHGRLPPRHHLVPQSRSTIVKLADTDAVGANAVAAAAAETTSTASQGRKCVRREGDGPERTGGIREHGRGVETERTGVTERNLRPPRGRDRGVGRYATAGETKSNRLRNH